MDNTLAKTVAKAIFYASIQASIGSVEMNSKFAVINFSKDQETLQRAADALKSYVIVASVWTVGTMLALYASYGMRGAWVAFVANLVMMAWIFVGYINAFKEAARKYDLQEPTLFTKEELYIISFSITAFAGGLWYFR